MDDKLPGEARPNDTPPGGHEPDRSDRAFDLPESLSREVADGSPEEQPPERSGTITVLVIAGLILIGGSLVIWWWYTSRSNREADAAAAAAAAAEVAATQEAAAAPPQTALTAEAADPEPPPLPALYESDSLVRDVVGSLSQHASWLAWLVPEELVMNFVRVVGAVAYDEPPQSSLAPLRPDDGFSVVRRGQRFYPAETSYRRYDIAVDVFDSIDAAGAARAYERLASLFEQAHDELGYPNEFGDTLELAVTKLLATPMPDALPELRLRVISFEYVDPGLERLSPAQKLLLRLGPENGDRVRAKLRELYGALN